MGVAAFDALPGLTLSQAKLTIFEADKAGFLERFLSKD